MGRSEDELVGSAAPQVVHPHERADSLGNIAELLEGRGDEVRREGHYLRPDGTVVWPEAVTQVVRSAAGTPLYVQSALFDVTARKAVEQARVC